MTDKQKIERLETLGWDMYYAAQNLTTDASSLHKAMNKWWQFVNHELQEEEPVSEDLEEAAREYVTPPCALGIRTFIAGANWREKQMMKNAYVGVYDCDDNTSWIGFEGWLLSTSKVGKKVKLIIIKE